MKAWGKVPCTRDTNKKSPRLLSGRGDPWCHLSSLQLVLQPLKRFNGRTRSTLMTYWCSVNNSGGDFWRGLVSSHQLLTL